MINEKEGNLQSVCKDRDGHTVSYCSFTMTTAELPCWRRSSKRFCVHGEGVCGRGDM